MLKQQHQVFVGLLVAADAAVVVCASFGAWLVRRTLIHHAWWPRGWDNYPKDALVLYTVPVTLLALHSFGLYRARRDRTIVNEITQIFKACAAAMLGVLAILYIFDSSLFQLTKSQPNLVLHAFGHAIDAGRVQLGALAIALPIALSMHRVAFRNGLRYVRRRGWNLRHVAVIGCGRLGQIVTRTLERNSWTGLKVSYFISHQPHTRRTACMSRPVLGGLDELERILETRKPDAVYVALPSNHAGDLPKLLARLEKFVLDVRIVPDVNPRYVPQSMVVSELDGMPVLSYRECPTSGVGGLSKRALDIFGAMIGLIVFAPAMALIAAALRLSGPGPVIFKQRRVSLGGQVFDIYKFRTMHHAADEQETSSSPGWTTHNDPRITRIGRWLRRTSLDELPQLFNVLTGEMSLVGPRPERPELIERFREDWRGYMLRQHVKAGMTGWAQINGHRGNSSLRKRVQYDLFYVKNWSLSFDLKIILLTFVRGFVHKNAH